MRREPCGPLESVRLWVRRRKPANDTTLEMRTATRPRGARRAFPLPPENDDFRADDSPVVTFAS